MDRLPSEILLEIIDCLSANPSPSELYCFLAASPAAAAALAAHPLSLDQRITAQVAAIGADNDAAVWEHRARTRKWPRYTCQTFSTCSIYCAGYVWPAQCRRTRRFADQPVHPPPESQGDREWLAAQRARAAQQERWLSFRRALNNRDQRALWRSSLFGRGGFVGGKSTRVKKRVERYGMFG